MITQRNKMQLLLGFSALIACAVSGSPFEAKAQETPPSVSTTSTLPDSQFGGIQPSKTVLGLKLGYPSGLQGTVIRSLNSKIAVGALVESSLGWSSSQSFFQPFRFGAPIRLSLIQNPKMSSGLWITPSIDFRSNRGAGFGLDIDYRMGFRIHQKWIIGLGANLPIHYVPSQQQWSTAMLIGPQIEYQINDRWSLTAEAYLGPSYQSAPGTNQSNLNFQSRILFGVTFHF
jgi:hypothetical protein